jgi:Xaa-Pro dipeptidase
MLPRQEFVERLNRLQAKVAENQLDAFLVSAEDSIYYLTGVSYKPFERPFFLIVFPKSPSILLVPALEMDHLKSAPNVNEIRHYWDYPSPKGKGWADCLLSVLEGVKHFGIEPSTTQEISQGLKDLSPQAAGLVEELRMVKSAVEVEMLRNAARYIDLGMHKVIKASYKGVSLLELFSQARSVQMMVMKDRGFDLLTTNLITVSSPAPMSAQPHGVPSISDRLGDGPHIALSVGRINGYAAECERTYFLTPPTQQFKDAFVAMLEARRRAFEIVKPGTSCAEIDATVKAFLIAEGYGDNLLHRTGHGFGLGNHEAPWIAEGSTTVLQENMLLSIEPGIYLPDVGGIRHSDTILVTKNGYEKLTKYPTDLETLTLKGAGIATRLMGVLTRKIAGI